MQGVEPSIWEAFLPGVLLILEGAVGGRVAPLSTSWG